MKTLQRSLTLVASLGLLMSAVWTTAAQVPARDGEGSAANAKGDDLPSPRADKQRKLRTKGLEKVLNGKASPAGDNKVVKVAKGQYVELAREGEDEILTVLGEFGTHQSAQHGGDRPGPLHNQIPEPDRSVDNTTIWTDDFSPRHIRAPAFLDAPAPSRCATSTRSSRPTATR